MLAYVSDEWAGLGEGLAANQADAGLLSCETWITISLWLLGVDNICVCCLQIPQCVCVWMSWENLCGCVHAAAELQGHWRLSDSAYRCRASPRCEPAGVSSDFLKGRHHHTKVRPKASKQRHNYRSQPPLNTMQTNWKQPVFASDLKKKQNIWLMSVRGYSMEFFWMLKITFKCMKGLISGGDYTVSHIQRISTFKDNAQMELYLSMYWSCLPVDFMLHVDLCTQTKSHSGIWLSTAGMCVTS